MTVYVIRSGGLAGRVARRILDQADPPDGAWLARYDPEAHGGRGEAEWTVDPLRARTFASYEEAFNLWRAVPRAMPRRPDGQPNRPLTAYSVSIEKAER